MASQNERSTRNTTPTQSQLDSLAAFLSDWCEDSVRSQTLAGDAEEEKDTEDVQTRRSSSSLLEHPPPAAYDLPSGALRRRSSYMSSASTSTGTGTSDGEYNHENGDGAMASMAIMDSLATNPLPILPLPFDTLHEPRQMEQEQEALSPLHQEVPANVPPSSALMSLDNGKEPSASARLGNGAGGILPPPPLANPRPTEHRVDMDTSEADAPSSSSTPTSSNIKARPPAA